MFWSQFRIRDSSKLTSKFINFLHILTIWEVNETNMENKNMNFGDEIFKLTPVHAALNSRRWCNHSDIQISLMRCHQCKISITICQHFFGEN